MRPTRGPDLRTVAAFVVVLATGLAVLWVVTARPPAGDDVLALSEQAAAGPIEPAWLAIPAIGVDAPVEHRGTATYENPFTGRTVEGYGVPESMLTTSWWSDGPAPGSGQMAVVLGHQQDGGDAVFNRLHELAPGDEVVLRDARGAALRLTVLGEPLTGLDKATSALSDALNGHPAEADVALVTCGGEFDDAAGTSTENTVVFATVAGGA
ncbi:Sortase family protein [Blastococcus sp. DSM 46786]|uniref:class F sortase n=1 Tax=Blastococcus sp. DSM 46786 TaxID=1798227 RepID=UPI0008AD89D3|nr:class F sortase [Blastococcus sp. DSM 46786]SEK42877.1 Sortase family protein [Blastococcus sp. DSM 46786]